jgi:hypothetical protein
MEVEVPLLLSLGRSLRAERLVAVSHECQNGLP